MTDVTINDLGESLVPPEDDDFFVFRDISGGVDLKIKKSTFLGAAAELAVTLTPTDTTPDALTKTGDFGLGSITSVTLLTDLTTSWNTRGSGNYKVDTNTLGLPADFGTGEGTLQFIRRDASATSEELDGVLVLHKLANDASRGLTSSWAMNLYDADFNSADWINTDFQKFGLGGNITDLGDVDFSTLDVASGMYSIGAGSTNVPSDWVGVGYLNVSQSNANNSLYTLIPRATTNPEVFIGRKIGGVWDGWIATNPQAFGWGSSTITESTDLDTLVNSGQYSFGASTTNRPAGTNYGAVIHVVRLDISGTFRWAQVAFDEVGKVWNRTNINGVVSAWVTGITDAEVDTKISEQAVLKDSNTGAAAIPVGGTLQRPAVPQEGDTRGNSDTGTAEIYLNGEWGGMGGGAAGGAGNPIMYLHDKTVTEDFTIPSDQNALSAGPLDIDVGVEITIEDGATWTVV